MLFASDDMLFNNDNLFPCRTIGVRKEALWTIPVPVDRPFIHYGAVGYQSGYAQSAHGIRRHGANAFDVYTLYKSAAKRRLTDTIETSDVMDMQCLAWMTKEQLLQARRLLRKLGYITEVIDKGEGRKPEIRQVRIEHRSGRNQ